MGINIGTLIGHLDTRIVFTDNSGASYNWSGKLTTDIIFNEESIGMHDIEWGK